MLLRKSRAVFVLTSLVLSLVEGCPYREVQHTLCQYRAAACPGKSLIRSGGLGCTEKQLILDAHNQLRQSVALGHVSGQPPATGMREMVWDEELAAIAQRWADQCRMGHDTERNVGRFPVGQNVALTWTHETPSPKGPGPDFRRQVEDWFGEVMKWGFRRNDLDHFHFSERTGHYSQLVWSDTYLVGCGYSYYKDSERGYTKLYVCNYGPGGNVIGEHLYEAGSPSCSSQELSTSRRYAGLCEVRGSNPPGMFCSAHDALFATQGAYHSTTLQPAARPMFAVSHPAAFPSHPNPRPQFLQQPARPQPFLQQPPRPAPNPYSRQPFFQHQQNQQHQQTSNYFNHAFYGK